MLAKPLASLQLILYQGLPVLQIFIIVAVHAHILRLALGDFEHGFVVSLLRVVYVFEEGLLGELEKFKTVCLCSYLWAFVCEG